MRQSQQLNRRHSIRQQSLKILKSLTPSAKAAAANNLLMSLKQMLIPGDRVAMFLNMGHEIDTSLAVLWCWRHGIEVFMPQCFANSHGMTFASYTQQTGLFKSRHGFWQPVGLGGCIHEIKLTKILVPSVALDSEGYRLGSGFGYYDRALSGCDSGLPWKIYVAYQACKVDHCHPLAHDIRADQCLFV